MSRNGTESRVHEIRLLQKRIYGMLATITQRPDQFSDGQRSGLRLAMQILGDRRREIKAEAVSTKLASHDSV